MLGLIFFVMICVDALQPFDALAQFSIGTFDVIQGLPPYEILAQYEL